MYLELKFHDNDFGMSFIQSLKDVWNYIKENNGRDYIFSKTSYETVDVDISPFFVKLHKSGKLVSMIHHLVVLNHMKSPVEWMTRGLNRDYDIKEDLDFTDLDHYKNYLKDFSLEFHDNDDFTNEWMNSEHFYLDITTGEVKSF